MSPPPFFYRTVISACSPALPLRGIPVVRLQDTLASNVNLCFCCPALWSLCQQALGEVSFVNVALGLGGSVCVLVLSLASYTPVASCSTASVMIHLALEYNISQR